MLQGPDFMDQKLVGEDCTIDGLKECNRWFIDAFGSTGENVVLIEKDYNKALSEIIGG